MKFAKGNEKLGYGCLVVSRAVENSCPSSCYFLKVLNKNGNPICYASGTEKRFNSARQVGLENMATTTKGITKLIQTAISRKKSIRIHERGDFGNNDKVDNTYINNWVKALSKFRGSLPDTWVYTHIYDKRISGLSKLGVTVYASVHNETQLKLAKRAGFKLFAYLVKTRKKKGGSTEFPKYIEIKGLGRTLVCPEQRLGRKRVTCTGSNSSSKNKTKTTACNWCVKGKNNIVFLEH